MSDPRSAPDPRLVTLNEPAQVGVPITDILREPAGKRDRQLVLGDALTILGRMETFALIRSEKDGYCGWVSRAHLSKQEAPTHRLTVRASHIYEAPDIKSPDVMPLFFGSALTAQSETATFIETARGFVPRQHVHTIDTVATDPAAVAELFLGTPYLWGGNSALGLDCSGLVQAACLACGIACPGDSDQQARNLGTELEHATGLQRNDVIFWKGHVALVCDQTTLIHANAGHMATVHEPIDEAMDRILAQGDGPATAFRRLPDLSLK